ncbi:tRNA dihydrouridine(20/20a) synthase DusA [Hydromonas duriensis]|uniref:tRNA-dihydrouridine(20/20a) synthase n=1 Tax=Hydromonas duriensis TaxID=1527608 RepID=A0A4R6Y6B6_9BURK|nr:tRNA dihydrouridine(20/20a) synthase DusA [Hydromonas duriensis]TDR30899.1 tRNA-U16,U17-dihydrouridine synthase [Hydromonas duriensis]
MTSLVSHASSVASLEQARRFSIAPMLDWTDRHCRYFHRLLSKNVLLYTEMVNVNAIIHGDTARHLDFDASEHPLALQVGGSDVRALAQCAKIAEQWGYDEININCGCPSERVQSGAFGACLMAEPFLVADAVKAMRDACSIDVTVKHRIGLDKNEDYGFVRDFIGAVSEAGCATFVVHARNAWLKGLSPKENRDIPPLRYEVVHQLKRDFPQLNIIINGGLADFDVIQQQLQHVDGVMVGRQAYHEPYWLARVDGLFFGDESPAPSRRDILEQLLTYAERQILQGVPLRNMTRHWLNLYHGVAGARTWRRHLSDAKLLASNDVRLLLKDVPNDALLEVNEYD